MNKDVYRNAMDHLQFSVDLDEKILEHLGKAQKVQPPARRRRKLVPIAAVMICLVCIFGGIQYFTGNSSPTSEKEHAQENLAIITFSYGAEGAGGADGCGYLIIKSGESLKQGNPTLNHTGEIKKLPVFKQESGGIEEELDGHISLKELEKKLNFSQTGREEEQLYDFDGAHGELFWSCFDNGKGASLADALLNYEFKRIEGVDGADEGGAYSKIQSYYRMPKEKVGEYPIITEKEAEKKLRQGKFFSPGDEKNVAATAEILSVELTYMKEEYQSYIQPAYKFVITDQSWKKGLDTIMKRFGWADSGQYTSVSEVYVPALPDQYLEIAEPRFFVN